MANKKAEILTMDGQVVSPITLATNVLLDDGHTAQDLLDSRDESMFSPTITTSSSISKVGQGDNVDFSENIIDGAYKSCVLKGKTLVNYNAEGNNRNEYACMPSVEGSNLTVNGTVEGKVKSAILKGNTLVNVNRSNFIARSNITTDYANAISLFDTNMKASTTYTIIAYSDNLYNYRLSEMRNEREVGLGVLTVGTPFVYTTDTAFTGLRGYLKGDILNIPKGTEIKILIVEGDHSNEDIPYFEGMQSVKMPVLTTTGKNLIQQITFKISGDRNISNESIKITKGVTYTLSFSNGIINAALSLTRDNKAVPPIPTEHESVVQNLIGFSNFNSVTFTAVETGEFYLHFRGNVTITSDNLSNSNIQLEESPIATPYEPYKSNILTVNEDVTLRGIGDVRDTLDLTTGELTQNFDVLTLNGSEDWKKNNVVNGNFIAMLSIPELSHDFKVSNTMCDKLSVVGQAWTGINVGISMLNTSIYISIDGNTISNIEDFKTWLSNDVITLIYKKSKEVIKTVDLSDNVVYSYKDTTHYTCSSQEGSLLPTLAIEEGVKYKAIIKPSTKYSIVFNRTEVASGLTVDLGGATANVVSTTLGKNIVQTTTPSTLSHSYVVFKGLGNVIKDVQVIEGEVVGDEPYFEGMVDVKNPSVMNCNTLDTKDENYKSNTISSNEVVLRSLPNGVCDTLDLETGEYVQRIGEIVLDGNQNFIAWGSYGFYISDSTLTSSSTVRCINNKYPSYTNATELSKATGNGIAVNNSRLYIKINEVTSVNEFVAYLKSNPITVQYELATPIITTIDLKQHPFAYKDGYVVLTSSSEEVSLTPIIEYSLIANRLGQIQSNQKLVEKQQTQIDELESMVVANLVNTQYQQALNEIKLGVK